MSVPHAQSHSRTCITSIISSNSRTRTQTRPSSYHHILGTRLLYKNKEYDDDAEESNAKRIQTTATTTTRQDTIVPTTNVPENKQEKKEKPKIISRVVNSSVSSKKDGRKNVHLAKNLEEYREKMNEYKDRLVVFRFYSSWCKSCKAVEPKYHRLARMNPKVGFVDIPITRDNQEEITKEFDIKSVPFGHIVHPQGGLVERLHMGKMYWDQFEDTFYTYVHGYCDVSSSYYE